ncbi:MAG: recombinase family protein, partial [Rickettsiales bacterium]|nr:recombinase family protein [Rickettsiales bacterium]
MSEHQKVRCAVYTRKSRELGLEQEYNSLDAQRDAGISYIQSQRGRNWVLLPEKYDDGGWSGGTMDRPAIKRLYDDIEKGLIDVVVVYKIDRLSRSQLDFLNMIEFFKKHRVAFVSVTQNFDTSTPMGELMLSILISFAQFERKQTS